MSLPARPALAVMARAPIPGQVKTRLQPYLTPEESANLYSAFLLDAIDLAISVRQIYTPFTFFTPLEERALFNQIIPQSLTLLPQSEGGLGQRMYDIFVQLADRGYSPIVIVGSDLPALQPVHLEKAVESLVTADVCLGPSRDGGYYLIGAQKAYRNVFEGITWSTPQVLEATVAKAKAANLSLALLETCGDVDTIEDLRWLRGEIERLKRIEGARIPFSTEAYLQKLTF